MGRQDFNRLTAVRAMESRSLVLVNNDSIANVPAAGSVTVDIYSPVGTISRVVGLDLNAQAPVDATVGTHSFQVLSTPGGIFYLFGRANYNAECSYRYGEWTNALNLEYPADPTAQVLILKTIGVTDTVGLRLIYFNDTDVAQAGQRYNRVLFEREVIA